MHCINAKNNTITIFIVIYPIKDENQIISNDIFRLDSKNMVLLRYVEGQLLKKIIFP